MDKKGKSIFILSTIILFTLLITMSIVIAHKNPNGKHPVGIETESCQGALAGAEEQVSDRGEVNPRLLDNILDKCGIECGVESGEWTQWLDRDNPSAVGDFETLNELRNENPGEICENPTQIECKTLDGRDYTETGQNVTCNTEIGFFCRNDDNGGSETNTVCEDYKIRVYCEEPTLVCNEITECTPTPRHPCLGY